MNRAAAWNGRWLLWLWRLPPGAARQALLAVGAGLAAAVLLRLVLGPGIWVAPGDAAVFAGRLVFDQGPEDGLETVAALRAKVAALRSDALVDEKRLQLDQIILDCLGLTVTSTSREAETHSEHMMQRLKSSRTSGCDASSGRSG